MEIRHRTLNTSFTSRLTPVSVFSYLLGHTVIPTELRVLIM